MIKEKFGRGLWIITFAQYRLSQTTTLFEMGYENMAKLVSHILSTVILIFFLTFF
jgi:hypothetical protein